VAKYLRCKLFFNINRLQKKIEKLNCKLSNLQYKMEKLTDGFIKQICDNNNLSEPQQILLREIINTSKVNRRR